MICKDVNSMNLFKSQKGRQYIMFKQSYLVLIILSFMVLGSQLLAQDKGPRKSLKASVSQTIGTETEITITYSRPGVKDREIWGKLVKYGLNEGNKYSKGKAFPWRAGADENTTIEFSTDVMVAGKEMKAGKYGLHMIPGKKEFVIIFSKVNDIWGSYAYDEANDALRITVAPKEAAHKEWLSYDFVDLDGTSATVNMHWAKLKVGFKVATK